MKVCISRKKAARFVSQVALTVSLVLGSATSMGADRIVSIQRAVIDQSTPYFACFIQASGYDIDGSRVEYRLGGYGVNGVILVEGPYQIELVGRNVRVSSTKTSIQSIERNSEKPSVLLDYEITQENIVGNSGRVSVKRKLASAMFYVNGTGLDLVDCHSLNPGLSD